MAELDPLQLKAISELHSGSILKGGTGSGKTRTSLAYYLFKICEGSVKVNGEGEFVPMQKPVDLYVLTTARKRDSLDWEEEAIDYRISREPNLEGARMTVDSWNNIEKYKDVENAFFIFDEQRLVGRGAWVKAFYKIAKKNRWILLSATPGDNWMDYRPVFIANGFYKNMSDFNDQHIMWASHTKFPVVKKWMNEPKLKRHRDRIVVEMPIVRHTVRHVKQKIVDYDRDLFKRVLKTRWNIYEDKPVESLAEYYYILRKVVNSDPSRCDAIRELLEEIPRLVVFYNFDYELSALRDLAHETGIRCAEWNGHRHQPVPDTDNWLYLVQYTAGAEAWNCTTTDSIAFYSLNYSYKVTHQAMGRIDRMNTPFVNLYYFQLRSQAAIDIEILKALQRKETFSESKSRLTKAA